ncbi:iron-sulfur cluster biosynthesis family protein [Enterococcus faecium]|uniref:iron-sulfur cluster biosynthesis family protein n=1 Tax=Enterococcus faecium TaxID=1352 RepID=UPI001D5DFEFC|nr:iron-sulfur cluster biosynthesis family protein [Enterococcus faecium]EME8097159.1 iron-sulfur cluster biosynthesis family protein [Enterococcus faecium]NTQ14805.1 iron-sulfur cluster biosynthesis family protein [Enterococcus faecium]NTQ17056.1 iron-sulfur cluster biosynthesis family protein [Enterococcus faecium]NTR67517.1 iron-sulfur cluster biosynthesis family protein [Enterococcus faecium]NTR97952.1 iron-sulfur cluster biosynthesis family protein [Enterococcus faecium]
MYLKITEQAQERLQKYIDEGATVILDLDDGVGEYSKMGVCSLDTSFRLLLLDKEQRKNDYKLQLDSDIGDVYIKDYSKMYMDEHMTLSLDPRLGVFTLESPRGSLDSHVQLVDLRPEKFSGMKQ